MNERLKRLEWHNRILKWAGAALLALVVVTLALQSAPQQRIFIYADEPYIECGEVVTGEEVAFSLGRR